MLQHVVLTFMLLYIYGNNTTYYHIIQEKLETKACKVFVTIDGNYRRYSSGAASHYPIGVDLAVTSFN